MNKIKIRFQNKIILIGLNEKDCQDVLEIMGKVYKIAIASTNPITPPNLLGTLRRMVYANKKYHSGWMWMGVTIGFAIIKFSGSIRILGEIKQIKTMIINKILNPIRSLEEKNGWNGIFIGDALIPNGLEEPVSWRNIKCKITKTKIINGNKKWKE